MRFLLATVFALAVGCAKQNTNDSRQAAAQLEQSFAAADAATKQSISAVSEAMRNGDYNNAVVSLNVIRAQPAATPEQHEAVQKASVTLETQLIRAMESGDEKAKASYQLLKEIRRN